MTHENPAQFINTKLYPVSDIANPSTQKNLQKWRNELRETGACILENFLTPEAVTRMIHEANGLLPLSFWNEVTGNAYLSKLDEKLPANHPQNLVDTTALGVIAYDQFKSTDALLQLFRFQAMTDFIAEIVGRGKLFHYNCPMGALNISVMKDNDYLRWHFDQSDFVVSIPLQHSTTGGEFEFVRHIRNKDDQKYSDVGDILRGGTKNVEILKMPPGSLILFEGRYTIHRVSQIKGDVPRLVALLSYDTKPDTDSTDYLKMIRYGRVK